MYFFSVGPDRQFRLWQVTTLPFCDSPDQARVMCGSPATRAVRRSVASYFFFSVGGKQHAMSSCLHNNACRCARFDASAGVEAGAPADAGGSTFTVVWTRSASFTSYKLPPGVAGAVNRSGDSGIEILCTTVTTQVPVQVTLRVAGVDKYSRTLHEPGTYLLGGVPRVGPFFHDVALQVRCVGNVEADSTVEKGGEEAANAARGHFAAPDVVVTSTCANKESIWDDDMLPLMRNFVAGIVMRPFVQRTVHKFGAETEVRFQQRGGHGLQLAVSRPGLVSCSIYMRPRDYEETRVLVGTNRAVSSRSCFQLECALNRNDDLDIVLDVDGGGDAGETTVELDAINMSGTTAGLSFDAYP